jgi:nicotinamide-nucleotide amidase
MDTSRSSPGLDPTGRRIELIAVGREILRGRVLDTNSHWLAQELTGLGGDVGRICVVDDVLSEIGREIHAASQHRVDVICTTGGLGPTFDDRTLEAIAEAVQHPLRRHDSAYAFIADTYRRLHAQGMVEHQAMTPSREKMALLPQGAEMLPNPTGSAPGMLLQLESLLIIAMPGPPSEMKPMFQISVAPRLRARWSGRYRLEIKVQTNVSDESLLNPLFERIMAAMPGSYLKADPKGFGPDVQLAVYITVEAASEETARSSVHEVQAQLRDGLQTLGYALLAEA